MDKRINSSDSRIVRFFDIAGNTIFDKTEVEDIINSVGINTVITDRKTDTSFLSEAIVYENEHLVAFLLDHGADPNLKTESLDPAIWETRGFDDPDCMLRIAKLLLDHGADPNSVLDDEPFYYHIDCLQPECINFDRHEDEYLIKLSDLLESYGGRLPWEDDNLQDLTEIE